MLKMIFLFLGQAALVTAGLNIFIPKLLGEVVNVLAVLARGEHTHNYFSMIRTPATKLMVCYLLQVSE